ncbi:MAG: NAD-binding protein, partial [Gammaproteobacteria bacterium]
GHLGGVAAGVSDLSGGVSFGALGSGVQIILGAGLLLSGVALFWKLRVAWVFALMLLAITIAVNVGKGHFGGSMIIPSIAFILLAILARYFDRHTVIGGALMSGAGIIAVLAYGTFGIYLLGNQFDPHIDNPLTALYFTIETLSTTGYGDYHPVTLFAQGYMITLWVVGLSVFATALFSILGPALSGHLSRLFNPSGVRTVPKNHVIVVGTGAIAHNAVRELARRQVPLMQVIAPGAEPPVADQPFVTGGTSDTQVLEEAGIAHARTLVAAAAADGENAFIVLAAKDMNPKLKVLAVASDRQAARRLRLAHADMVFAPAEVGGRLLADMIEGEELPAALRDLFAESG